MYYYFDNKKILEILIFGDILLKTMLIDDKFKFTNEFSFETIKKIKNIYIKTSSILLQNEINEQGKNFDIINKFLSQIINFINEFNKKCLTLKKNSEYKYTQIIFDEDSINMIFKNIFLKLNDFSLKQKIINSIGKLDLEKELIIKNVEIQNNNYILSTPFFVIIMIVILFEIKDYKTLFQLYSNLFELMNYSIINIKLLLNFDIINITMKILIDLFAIELDVEENEYNIFLKKFYDLLLSLLKILLKFTPQSSLIKYLSNIFSIFFDNIYEKESYKKNRFKILINELFSLLKEDLNPLTKIQKQNYQYLSISKKNFNNPFIYNIFFINNLKRDEAIIHFNLDIRINSFDSIENFWIANFINEKMNQSLFISINNKNQLIIGEQSINKNQEKINQLASFENINEHLLTDNNFHNISVIIDIENKNLKILIDYKYINQYKKIINYNNFLFDDFNIIIGYDYDVVTSFNSKFKDENNISIIDISNIILLNYKNDVDNYFLNTMKEDMKKNYINDNILEELFLNKKEYYYKFVLVEICFNLNFIKIINNTKDIKNIRDINIFKKYLNKDNEEINKYISYIDIINPFSNIENLNIYMTSSNNNIENYLSANNILSLQNKKKILSENIFHENYNIFYSSSNYSFVDFLIGFLFDIDKRNEYIINKLKSNDEHNIENNIESNTVILKDEYINKYIIIILDIILNLRNKKNINYILYETDNISIKIKIFFKKNIYLLNDKDFLIKLIELLNKKCEHLLIFGIEIFLDLLIFPLLNLNIQNIILISINKMLENPIKEKDMYNKNKYKFNEDIGPLLCKLLEKFYNLILYYELSNSEINDNNENNKKQIDIIISCILSIFEKIDKQNNDKYENLVKDLSINIINICSKLQESIQTHNIKQFLDENENILIKNNIFIDNHQINTQIELVTNIITKYLAKLISKHKNNEILTFDYCKDSENNNVIKIDLNQKFYSNNKDGIICLVNKKSDSDLNDSNISLDQDYEDNYEQSHNITFSKNCSFCLYLFSYFKIRFDAVYDEIKYEKYNKKFYRNLFINFDELKAKLGTNKYVWYLSQNESSHRIQNKFFIKENKIKIIGNNKRKEDLFKYQYINDFDKYKKTIIELNQIFLYDNISIDHHFLDSFKNSLDSENNIILAENCLLINNIQKTNSLFLIYNDYLLIITNICVDNENKLHVAIDKFNMDMWCIKNEEYISQLNNYIKNNEKNIIKNFSEKEDKIKDNEFGYDKIYKFKIKKIKYSEINEIHKTSYLQIPNSIEIITNKGKAYFLCFNIEKRDFIFCTIIENIAYLNSSGFKKNKIKHIIAKRINKTNLDDDCFYMKNCPLNYLENTKDNTLFSYIGISAKYQLKKSFNNSSNLGINKRDIYNKAIVDKNTFLTEVYNFWIKNKISNFDYLMLLNTLSGRSLINLSQYFIFPFIIKEFDHNILNWLNKSIYRDLSVPIFACHSFEKNDLSNLDIKKFEVNEIGTKYHSGTFYSTYAFISYFLIRQHPYTEIHLEIQGGVFDSANRLFVGTKELSHLEEKYQELIPSIYTLPELYINTNNFSFGKVKRTEENIEKEIKRVVNDFELPQWTVGDPRKFILILKKVFENRKISQNLNYWIDLIFGYKMYGIEAIKSYNTYRKACYPINMEELEILNQNNELLSILIEKQELGYMGKQLFKKAHKNKEIISEEFKENENIFFDNYVKLKNIKLIEINKEIDIQKEKISTINNIMIETKSETINNTMNNKNYFHQGGVSSLKTIMNVMINDYNINNKNININKIINSFEKDSKIIILEENHIFLGDPLNNIILQYNKRIIKIMYNNYNAYSFYSLNEIGNISIITCNQKGNKIYVGFDNGDILIYKIKLYLNNIPFSDDKNYIFPFKTFIPVNNENLTNSKRKLRGSFKIKRNDSNISIKDFEIIAFENIKNNKFIFNNPRIPQKIERISIDEENNILISSTSLNMIYIISLNNNFQTMHIIPYFTKDYFNYQYKIKDILPLNNNGDFIVYSSLTVHLFSINGIPLSELNILDNFHNDISYITHCVGIFLYDVILFTGHKDGSIYIWKVINRNHSEIFGEKNHSIVNENKNKSFLKEYKYGYSFNFNSKDIKNFELQRKFDIINNIKIEQNNNYPIKYMKMSNDMSYMIVLTENKKIFILSSFDEDNNNSNNDIGNTNKKKKIYCCWCKKEIEDSYFRTTYITSIKNIKNDDNEFEIIDTLEDYKINEDEERNKKKKDYTYICEECKKKLVNIENYLYNY